MDQPRQACSPPVQVAGDFPFTRPRRQSQRLRRGDHHSSRLKEYISEHVRSTASTGSGVSVPARPHQSLDSRDRLRSDPAAEQRPRLDILRAMGIGIPVSVSHTGILGLFHMMEQSHSTCATGQHVAASSGSKAVAGFRSRCHRRTSDHDRGSRASLRRRWKSSVIQSSNPTTGVHVGDVQTQCTDEPRSSARSIWGPSPASQARSIDHEQRTASSIRSDGAFTSRDVFMAGIAVNVRSASGRPVGERDDRKDNLAA